MMSSKEIYTKIAELTSQFYFSFHGTEGVIDPISKKEIYLQFGNGDTIIARSVEEAIKEPFIEGKSIDEVANEIEIE